ncbi:DUF6928 family protein [Catenuloplanes japonicus]|uniref:DUF6928 family protein n=1 Tax=Catenuloplanes japonicus TaxID=33876 RepID=UPI0012FA7778|nr:hypothetical protein [Catenuloplanes japonicus]
MGVKTALLAISDGDVRPALRGATRSASDAEELVRGLLPGRDVTPAGEGTLRDRISPPDDLTYAAVLRGASVVCDRRFALERPSRLPAHLLKAAGGRRITVHAMDSVTGWVSFGVWENGALVRSLSRTGTRILEHIGTPYDFERSADPTALGEEALRALFGFVIAGRPHPGDIHAGGVRLHGFRVEDPLGQEQALRQAMSSRLRHALHRRPLTTT